MEKRKDRKSKQTQVSTKFRRETNPSKSYTMSQAGPSARSYFFSGRA